MDIFSLLLLSIYIMLILIIVLYVSPVLSAIVMFVIPAVFVIFMPDEAIQFLSTMQFSFGGIVIQNMHILLLIWSAIIGVIAYSEILSWYFFRGQKLGSKQRNEKKDVSAHLQKEQMKKRENARKASLLGNLSTMIRRKK
jgi:predicted membrane protein